MVEVVCQKWSVGGKVGSVRGKFNFKEGS